MPSANISDTSSDFLNGSLDLYRGLLCMSCVAYFCCYRTLSIVQVAAAAMRIISALWMPYAQRTHFKEFSILFFVHRKRGSDDKARAKRVVMHITSFLLITSSKTCIMKFYSLIVHEIAKCNATENLSAWTELFFLSIALSLSLYLFFTRSLFLLFVPNMSRHAYHSTLKWKHICLPSSQNIQYDQLVTEWIVDIKNVNIAMPYSRSVALYFFNCNFG